MTREVDCSFLFHGTLGEPLRDPDYFRQVRVDEEARTVVWPNGLTRRQRFCTEITNHPRLGARACPQSGSDDAHPGHGKRRTALVPQTLRFLTAHTSIRSR